MNVKKVISYTLVTLALLAVCGYVAYATIFMSKPDPKEKCEALELTVQADTALQYIDKSEVEAMLKKNDIYPVGKLMSQVNLSSIESILAQNEYVEKVECYKSAKSKLCIKVVQRTPVIYILPEGQKGYFVDANGKRISNTHYAANLVTATGAIDEKYATTALADFGNYLKGNTFWNNQIVQINVVLSSKGERKVELVPRVGDHIIEMGTLDNYEDKLRRLKVFYEKAMNTVGWDKYETLNVEYGKEVIGKKKDKK